MKNRLLAHLAMLLALVAPAAALEIKSDARPGALPSLTAPGEIAINRADGRLFYRDEAGNRTGGLLPDLDASGYLKFRSGMTLGRYQDGKFSLLGDGSLAGVLSMPGGTARSLADRFSFRLSGLDNMPDTLVAQVTAVTDTSAANAYLSGVPSSLMPDVTTYLRGLVSRRATELPCGTYRITDTIEIPASKGLNGLNPGCVHILVGYKIVNGTKVPDFNSAATSIIKLNTNANLRGVRVNLAQPDVDTRSLLVAYPIAIDASAASGGVIADIVVAGARDGLICKGNCGSLSITNVQVGSYRTAFSIDGALNYVFGSANQAWPHGFLTENLLKASLDGNNVGLDLGQVEALSFNDFHSSGSAIVVRDSTVSPGKTTFGNIGVLSLDGAGATLRMQKGQMGIATLYTTKDGNQNKTTLDKNKTLQMTGGELTVANWSGAVNGTKDGSAFSTDVEQTGGVLTIQGGVSRQFVGGAMLFDCSGGNMSLGLTIGSSPDVSFTRSAPFVKQAGTCNLDVSRAAWVYRDASDPAAAQSALPDGGVAVQFNSDTYGNRLDPARIVGWSTQVLGGRSKGSYGAATYTGTLDANGRATIPHGYYDLNGVPAYTQMRATAVACPPGAGLSGCNGTAVTLSSSGNVIDSSNFYLGLGTDSSAYANFKYKISIAPFR